MKYEKYPVRVSRSNLRYSFYSYGSKGKIAKQVVYEEYAERAGIYNLSFGDLDKNGNIDDAVVTDNGDSEKVLATVALTIARFFEAYPDSWVFITGSTDARTRLYRMGISKNLTELQNKFYVFGHVDKRWRPFEKNGNYEHFLVGMKIVSLKGK